VGRNKMEEERRVNDVQTPPTGDLKQCPPQRVGALTMVSTSSM
jgi:hypothetical protein